MIFLRKNIIIWSIYKQARFTLAETDRALRRHRSCNYFATAGKTKIIFYSVGADESAAPRWEKNLPHHQVIPAAQLNK